MRDDRNLNGGMRDLFILTGKMSDSFENKSGIRVKNRKSHVLS